VLGGRASRTRISRRRSPKRLDAALANHDCLIGRPLLKSGGERLRSPLESWRSPSGSYPGNAVRAAKSLSRDQRLLARPALDRASSIPRRWRRRSLRSSPLQDGAELGAVVRRAVGTRNRRAFARVEESDLRRGGRSSARSNDGPPSGAHWGTARVAVSYGASRMPVEANQHSGGLRSFVHEGDFDRSYCFSRVDQAAQVAR
jgi:hypothetical protein